VSFKLEGIYLSVENNKCLLNLRVAFFSVFTCWGCRLLALLVLVLGYGS
jgi:hypothetical protein